MHAVSERGLDVRVIDGVLSQVTFHLASSAHRSAYPDPDGIIEGLPVPDASKDEVTRLLGYPYKSLDPVMSRYEPGSGFVHFGWTNTGERVIVVLRDR